MAIDLPPFHTLRSFSAFANQGDGHSLQVHSYDKEVVRTELYNLLFFSTYKVGIIPTYPKYGHYCGNPILIPKCSGRLQGAIKLVISSSTTK